MSAPAPTPPAAELPVLSADDVALEVRSAPIRMPAPRPATARGPAAGKGARRDARGGKGKPPPPAATGVDAQVVADAVRLIKWGREWHELAEAIARIAGRPSVVEVRKVLRTHKQEIERTAAE